MTRIISLVMAHSVRKDVESILHLPLVERLMHHKARRPLICISLGICTMLLGSGIASFAKLFHEESWMHSLLVDTGGYFLHAVGAIPCLRYFDPVWTLVSGSSGEAVASAIIESPVIETIEEML